MVRSYLRRGQPFRTRLGKSGLATFLLVIYPPKPYVQELTDEVSSESDKVLRVLLGMLQGSVGHVSASSHKPNTLPLVENDFPDGVQSVLDEPFVLRCHETPALYCVNIGKRGLSLNDCLGPGNKSSERVLHTHALEFGEGRHSNTDTLGTNSVADGVKDTEGEPHSILDGTAILIGTVVGVGLKLYRCQVIILQGLTSSSCELTN